MFKAVVLNLLWFIDPFPKTLNTYAHLLRILESFNKPTMSDFS